MTFQPRDFLPRDFLFFLVISLFGNSPSLFTAAIFGTFPSKLPSARLPDRQPVSELPTLSVCIDTPLSVSLVSHHRTRYPRSLPRVQQLVGAVHFQSRVPPLLLRHERVGKQARVMSPFL